MIGGLADHAAGAGVTAGAARGDARVIERASREADEARVAGNAIGRGCDVGRGLRDRRDAGEGLAIVTGGAAGRDACVIHESVGECHGISVTGVARRRRRRDVICWHARRQSSIVASGAGPRGAL